MTESVRNEYYPSAFFFKAAFIFVNREQWTKSKHNINILLLNKLVMGNVLVSTFFSKLKPPEIGEKKKIRKANTGVSKVRMLYK